MPRSRKIYFRYIKRIDVPQRDKNRDRGRDTERQR